MELASHSNLYFLPNPNLTFIKIKTINYIYK